jgi:uncharacterized protein (TIGR03790 family)
LPISLLAGGSGLNVAVVINQNSSNSVALGNYFCEKRQVPPQNVLRVNWAGGNTTWTKSELEATVRNPLLSMIAAQQLTNQIDYVLLSMDLPFEDTDGTDWNSTTANLYYGFKPNTPAGNSCSLPAASFNSYAGSECASRFSPPSTASTNSFLVMMITSTTLDQAKAIIDRGVASDYSFPTQDVLLGHSSDPFRNVRYIAFDNTSFNTRLRGNYSLIQTNLDNPLGLSNLLGYASGHYQFSMSPGAFVPGAMADSLTSYSGLIFGANDQTTLFAFTDAGASACYGTVVEPCNYPEKFPSPQNYFYQSRGFNVAECYYQSVTNPYQGLFVGEPLAAPFAQPGAISWNSLPTNSLLAGTTNLSLQANGADTLHPIQQVDLFLDGTFLQTVTNIPPRTNNILYVTLNGFPTNFTVPAGANLKSVASNLTVRMTGTAYMNATKVHPYVHGDRIELQSTDITKKGAQVSVSVSNSAGTASSLNTFINTSRNTFLDTAARGIRSYTITNVPSVGSFLQLVAVKTNGDSVSVSVTNNTSGATIAQLGKALLNSVNTNAALQGADGLVVEDIVMHEDFAYALGTNDHSGDFDIHPRSPGWSESQIQVRILGSPIFGITPSGTNKLDANVTDLEPRDHLYLTAGATNLPVTFAFNTTTQADGFHELIAVAYEGSHVKTQTRASARILIQNSPLSATFDTLVGGTTSALETTLQFSVVANTGAISKIELFSTGGSLSNVLGQSTTTFSVAGTNMGIGLHPFYAIVTGTNGKQYRTETKWIRLIGRDSPFSLSISSSPVNLTWPATAGRSYDILSQTNLTNSFQVRSSVTPTNSLGQWTETNVSARERFYRVRTSN